MDKNKIIFQFTIVDTGKEFDTIVSGVDVIVKAHKEDFIRLKDKIIAFAYCDGDVDCAKCKKCDSEKIKQPDEFIIEKHSPKCTCTYCSSAHTNFCDCHLCQAKKYLEQVKQNFSRTICTNKDKLN